MKIARWVFLSAGILGLFPVVPVIYNLVLDAQGLLPDLNGMGLLYYLFLFQSFFYFILFIDI